MGAPQAVVRDAVLGGIETWPGELSGGMRFPSKVKRKTMDVLTVESYVMYI